MSTHMISENWNAADKAADAVLSLKPDILCVHFVKMKLLVHLCRSDVLAFELEQALDMAIKNCLQSQITISDDDMRL
eukprot:jgi/Hompol1/715/HPOL_002415-RA